MLFCNTDNVCRKELLTIPHEIRKLQLILCGNFIEAHALSFTVKTTLLTLQAIKGRFENFQKSVARTRNSQLCVSVTFDL